ncbi:MAG: MBL fold metallo-hydrolase [Treponemataceae bacterium]
MDLTFVGNGSAFNPVMENSNAFFTVGDRLYIIDCGETAFGKYWNLPALRNASEVTVVITHLHCDHVGSLGSLVSYCYYMLGKTIRIVHPLDTIVRLLDLLGIKRSCYRYMRELPEGPCEAAGFRAIQVEHVDDMTCFGYVITTPNWTVYFSGDAKSVPAEVVASFAAGRIDRIYQDTSLARSDHPTHGTLADLEAVFPPEVRDRVFCIHLDTDYRPLLREKGFGLVTLLEN